MRLVIKEDISKKRVLVRVDYNVPVNENGDIIDNSRIEKSLKTIKFLLENGAQVILISHFGRIKNENDIEKYSLKKVSDELSILLNKKVTFIKERDFELAKEIVYNINDSLILLENTRIYDLYDKMESNCSEELTKFYSELADVYVNDAFGASHRRHASTYGVRKYLPSYYGYLIDEELNNLNCLVDINQRPFTVFMGGAKVEDKLIIIKSLLKKCDYLCLGGGILNSFLKAKGFDIKNSLATKDDSILKELKILLDLYPEKILLSNELTWEDDKILDININDYKKVMENSKLVFINGTPGIFEEIKYQKGTKELFDIVTKTKAKTIIGGGDTASAVKMFNMEGKFSFISSGGGASLEYVAYNKLNALEEIC